MWHPPRTIKAALLAGFMLNFALWLASAYYFTRRVVESEARIGVIHARFLRGQELLFSVQNQVLLGSIYLRDALNEPNEHQQSNVTWKIQRNNIVTVKTIRTIKAGEELVIKYHRSFPDF